MTMTIGLKVQELQQRCDDLLRHPGPHSDALQSIFDNIPDNPQLNLKYVVPIRLPFNEWILDKTLHIRKPVDLDCGSGTFIVKDDQDGIVLHGQSSRFYRAMIQPNNLTVAANVSGCALQVWANGVTVRDVMITGTAIGLGYGRSSAEEYVNANNCYFDNIRIFKPTKYGIHIRPGSDTSGSLFNGVELIGGRPEVGILNQSFLGNVFVGCSIECVTDKGWWIPTNPETNRPHAYPYDTLIGCYSEMSIKEHRLSHLATIIGGNMVTQAGSGDRVGMGKSQIRFENRRDDGTLVTVNIPGRTLPGPLEVVLDARTTGGRLWSSEFSLVTDTEDTPVLSLYQRSTNTKTRLNPET